MLFLVDYDRRQGRIISMRSYPELQRSQANGARLALELDHMRAHIEREVVLLEARSEQAIRKTHRKYFENWEALASPA